MLLTSTAEAAFTFIAPTGFDHPETRAHVRLLGPCFKTGRMEPYGRQRPQRVVYVHRPVDRQRFERTGVPSATVDNRTNRTGHQPAPRGGARCGVGHGRPRAMRSRGLTITPRGDLPSSRP